MHEGTGTASPRVDFVIREGTDMSTDRSTLSPLEREKASVFHSWSAQASINPLMIKDAKGVYVTDIEDHTYLDFSSQFVNTNIGHQHPAVVRGIKSRPTCCARLPLSTGTSRDTEPPS